MCCCSRTVYPALDSPALKVNTISECSNQNVQLRRLIRVFARRTRRFVKPRDYWRYIRLAKALIRLLMCSLKSVQADLSLHTSFTVGFAMHRLVCNLFAQTLTLSTLVSVKGKIFNQRHFEIFFSFFQENRICISCKLSPLHEMSNPVFLVNKKNNEFVVC